MMVLSASVLFYCGDDDTDDSTDPYDQFIGSWLSTRIEFKTCNDPDHNMLIQDGLCHNGAIACFDATFNADGSYTFVDNTEQPAEVINGTITVTNNTFTLCSGGFCDTFNYTFAGDGNSFNITGDVPEDPPDCQLDIDFDKE